MFSKSWMRPLGAVFGLLLVAASPTLSRCHGQADALPNPFDFLPSDRAEAESPTPPRSAPEQLLAAEPAAQENRPVDAAQQEPPGAEPQETEPQETEPQETEPAEDAQEPAEDAQEIGQPQPPRQPRAQDAPPAEEEQGDALLEKAYQKAHVIDIEGPIFGRFHWYLNQRLDVAKRAGADLVLLRLTTPGGDLEQSLQLARRLRDIDWATTMVFIPQEAISGGAILSLGCDRILMRRGALIGDAGPIRMGMDGQFQHAEEKIVSFLAGAIRELALAKGRPAAIAEAMVDRSLILYSAVERATGRPTVLTEKEVQAPDAKELYDIGKQLPESGQNRFLTLGAERALELQLCEGVYASEQELLQQLNVARIEQTQLTWVDKTVYLLNRPWLTAILLVVGLIGLYLEFAAPGISVAGLTGVVCFGIFFWSHALGGTAGWLEVLLFVLGIACLLCELFVMPGFGVFGLSGFALVVVSLVMASQDFLLPNTSGEWKELQTNSLIVLGAALGVMLLFVGQVVLLDSIPGLNRFRLAPPAFSEPGPSFSATGATAASAAVGASAAVVDLPIVVGEQGIADSDLRPSGKVMLNGRLIDVVTEGDFVNAGSPVAVLKVEGNRVIVRKSASSLS